VKELEQQLQCLEAQKRTLLVHQHKAAKPDATPMHHSASSSSTKAPAGTTACVETAAATAVAATTSNCSSSVTEDAADHAPPPPFAQFFSYPQYVWCHSPRDPASSSAAEDGGGRPGVADIEVTLVETHASLRVMTPRRPGQLLGLVAGLQALRLGVLHLSVTALESLVLYSISVKVPRGARALAARCFPITFSLLKVSPPSSPAF